MTDAKNRSVVKIFAIFISFSLILLCSIVIIEEFFFGHKPEQIVLDGGKLEAIEKEALLSSFLKDSANDIKALAGSSLFQDYLHKGHNKGLVENLFLTYGRSHSALIQVRFIDKDGKERIRIAKAAPGESAYVVTEDKLPVNVSEGYLLDSTSKELDKVWFSRPELERTEGKAETPHTPVLSAVLPLGIDDQFGGIVIMRYAIQDLIEALLQSPFYDLILSDGDGYTIVYSEDDHIDEARSWGNVLSHKYHISREFSVYGNDILSSPFFRTDHFASKKLDVPIDGGIYLILKFKHGLHMTQHEMSRMHYMALFVIVFGLSIMLTYIAMLIFRKTLLNLDEVERLNNTLNETSKVAQIGFWEYDARTEKIHWTDGVYDIFEITDRSFEVSYEKFMSYVAPEDQQKLAEAFERSIDDKRSYFIEHKIITEKGNVRYVEERGKHLFDKDGNVLQTLGSVYDVTTQKEYEKELVESKKVLRIAKDEAEQASRIKSEFLANMSHEIRTPMNSIIGMTYLALNGNLEGKERNYIEKAHQSSESLLGILNDILDFSKIEAGKLELEETAFQLQYVISSMLNILSTRAKEKNIKTKVKIDKDVPWYFIGDQLRLSQVLINLGSNAIKFSPEDEDVLFSVSLLAEDEESATLQFCVQDKGIGISEEQQKNLFQSFSQADSSTTRKYGGTGLGLAISKNITQLMGGDIWLESEEGKGSSFMFSVVLKKQTASQIEQGAEGTENHDEGEVADKLKGAKILLVEDNELNQELAQDILSHHGMEFVAVWNGEEAIEMLKKHEFDGVLMDCQMPIMDGCTATRIIREDKKYKDLPIIALTANVFVDDIEKIRQSGLNDHISKPIKPEKMLSTMSKWIDVSARESEESR